MEAIIGAVIGGTALVASTSIPAFIQLKKLNTNVGSKNGHGNLVEMHERTLLAVGRLEEKVDAHIEESTEDRKGLHRSTDEMHSLLSAVIQALTKQ